MNDGVKILLERMKTNPEEFIGEAGFAYSKWGSLIGAYKEHLEVEDRTALTDALCKLHQQAFTEKVMEQLIDPKKLALEDVINQYRAKGIASATTIPVPSSITLNNPNTVGGTWGCSPYATSATIGANSLTLGSTTINEETLKHIQAHKTYLDAQKPKEHKTLFGRLFNYQ